jgi:homoserine O-succinyltransferase
MPLIIQGERVPSRWLERSNGRSSSVDRGAGADCLQLALVNNMPDAALEDTELQFFELLDAASGDTPVFIRLCSLSGVPRTERGQRHLNSFYCDCNELWKNRLDGMIITGTEPREPDLRHEPYWRLLTDAFDWAEQNTSSTVLSCLAAHASVLHSEGIPRHRLPDKHFGVFESAKNCDHALLQNVPNRVRFPHSRWNEVREGELLAAGYTVLTKSQEAGVDVFARKKRKSLFVHFQGHPEYGAQTLLKEYRRDIKRFLRGERETYPSMPYGYFEESAAKVLQAYKGRAVDDRREETIDLFPETVASGLKNGWQASAICVYRNWLDYLASRKAETSPFVSFARVRCASSSDRENRETA